MRKIRRFFIFLVLFSAFLFIKPVVNAESQINESDNIVMVGASIRTTGVQGLRFIAQVDIDAFLEEQNIEINDITKYGIVLSLGEANCDNLYIGGTVNGKNTLNGESSSLFNPETNEFTVVLYNINESLYLQGFSARGYIKYNDGSEKVVYSKDIITRSIYDVAKKSLVENELEYPRNVVNYVDNTLCKDVKDINAAKALYETSGNSNVTVRGVVTSVSSGTYLNLTIEDQTGALVLFNKSDATYSSILQVGNEVLLTGTITKYNGLYEITNMTNCVLVNRGVDASDLVVDVALPFESNDLIYQSKVVHGFLKYVSTSSKNMVFKTDNETSVLLYVDYKWSGFESQTLTTDEYYYINAIVSNYNGVQLIPYHQDNAILPIEGIKVNNLKESYLLGDFSYDDLVLAITLSDGSEKHINVNEQMISNSDKEKLKTSGSKDITINYLGIDTNIIVNLIEKNVKSIDVSCNDLEYEIGEQLNVDNLSLLVTYEDDTTAVVKVKNEMISGFDTSNHGNKSFTITYQNVQKSINYSVFKPLVIYDIYGAGGNSGAVYTNDFVVLYNNTNRNIDLNGYKLLYASSSGTSFTEVALEGTIYAKGYFVISLYKGENGVELPYYNFSSTNISAAKSSGRFALCYGDKPQSVTDASLIDNVLYSGISAAKSYQRTDLVNDSFKVTDVDLSYLNENVNIAEIIVSGIKTKYKLGDALDLTGVVFKAIYQNGSTEVLSVNVNDIVGFNTTTIGTFKMTYTYKDVSVGIYYTVSSDEGILDVDIYFIDLGDNLADCGESTYIKIGNDIDILIDAGENSTISANAVMNVIDKYCTDDTLDYVIASHAHSDHIGGMRYVLPNYNLKNVIEFDYKYGATESSNNVIGYYLNARKHATNIYSAYDLIVNQGDDSSYVMNIADGISFTFYNSGFLNTTASDKNQQSVICVFEAYGVRVLFNGDAEKQCEEIYAPLVGDVDIFKVPHHGTYNGTSVTLLENITPEVAIVCNGNYLGNEYGHPTYDALSRIYNYNANALVYAITGAKINSMEATTSNGPGATSQVLYAYTTTKRYNFYFSCSSVSDALAQRNGNINISITSEDYKITSEFYGNDPIEMQETNYWKNMYSFING